MLALIDIYEKYFERESFSQSLTTIGPLQKRGLIHKVVITQTPAGQRLIKAQVTDKGVSRLDACVYEFATAEKFLKEWNASRMKKAKRSKRRVTKHKKLNIRKVA